MDMVWLNYQSHFGKMSWCPQGTCRSSGSFSARSLFTGVSNKLYVGRVVSKQEGRRSLVTTVVMMRTMKGVHTAVSLRFLKDCETTKFKITFAQWQNLFLKIILFEDKMIQYFSCRQRALSTMLLCRLLMVQ